MSKIEEQVFLRHIEEHKGILYKVSRMYMDNVVDQEDLYQEILYQLWRSYERFNGESKFSTWMYRVSLNTAISYFKRDKRTSGKVDSLSELEYKLEEEKSEPYLEERVRYLYKAIYELNDVEKALIFLYLEGQSHQEIGVNLGISEGNARVRLNRTKNKLQEIIKSKGYEL